LLAQSKLLSAFSLLATRSAILLFVQKPDALQRVVRVATYVQMFLSCTEIACEGSDSDAEPPQKSAKIARALSPDDEVIMAQAKKEKLHRKLQTLLELPQVAAKQLDTGFVFKALQDANGSVVEAKRALLGA